MTAGGRQAGNLPEETTSMVGRRRELARVRRLCAESRLVTLTGSGGVGKTRLAVRAAADLRQRFTDGAWLVELSPLDQGPLLAHTIAEALPLADQTNRPMVDVLADYLADRHLLLVLDTCEHLVDACALLVEALLAVAPGLHILATSRRALGLLAEQVVTVEPLPVPNETGGGPQDAVALLADRAARVVPGFAVTTGNRDDVLRVCRRLEGLPLAIELAAARLHDLPLDKLAERLEDRFALLGDLGDLADRGAAGDGGRHVDPPRHRALRTAVGWSHELCTKPQRLAWARLSVFAGTFDAETARQVCADGRLPADRLQALLNALVDASILIWLPTGGGERYRMLDTVRDYGLSWLRDLGEHAELRRRHRDRYLDLARQGDAAWLGPDQYAWYDRIAAEHDNLRAALEFSLSEADGQTALEMAGALWFVWDGCGFPKEGQHYLDRALALATKPSPARAKALMARSLVALTQGDAEAAAVLAEEYMREGERHGTAHVPETGLALTMTTKVIRGDLRGAMELSKSLLDRTAEDGPTLTYFMVRIVAGVTYILVGRCEEAVAVLEQMRRTCDRHGERWIRSYGDAFRAQAELALGFPRAAQVYARAALEVKHRMNDRAGIAISLDILAPATLAVGHSRHAAYLLGLAKQVWDTIGRPQAGVPGLVAARQACERQSRATLGDGAYQTVYQTGYFADLATGIAHAVDPAHWRDRGSRPNSGGYPDG
ncbi:MAG TPA: NB-ARC domain-containing protein [Streptosporangiaceae bacterium]|nr:NB-ARC domain-containing protein [Streptosporangiaceae bacterium]